MASYPSFDTVGQMLDYWYGTGMNSIAKADNPVTSSSTGVFNAVFGAMAFNQLNHEANAFALLPKYPWPKSGFRVITTRGGTANAGGIIENGTLPNTGNPAFKEITVTMKEVAHTFDVSMKHELLSRSGDDTVGSMEFLRAYWADEHAQIINTHLLQNVTTVAGYNFESVDRVCSSYGEVTNCSDVNANDSDIYSQDRDAAASWADAYVDHNSGTDRILTEDMVPTAIYQIKANGGNTTIILTGPDTAARFTSLYGNQIRYPGVLDRSFPVQVGVNGVQTAPGMNAGVHVAALYGIPLFVSQNVVQDTISRVYFLDTSEQQGTGIPRLGIALGTPTLYFESGMTGNPPNPWAVNRLGTEGMYYTAGELVCTFFKAQGKIRDLK